MSSPLTPLSINFQAVRDPAMPEPIIRNLTEAGTLAWQFAFKWGNARVVRCQNDKLGDGIGSDGFIVLR